MNALDNDIIEDKIKNLLKRRERIDKEINQLEVYLAFLNREKNSGNNENALTYSSVTEQISDNSTLSLERMAQVPGQITLAPKESKRTAETLKTNSRSESSTYLDEKSPDLSAAFVLSSNPMSNEYLLHKEVNKNSSNDDKFALFISLFAGRPDVHAKRYLSKTKGTHGYSPVCNNLFIKGLCPKSGDTKKRIKCIDCQNRDFPGISLDEFIAHIKGENRDFSDVLGAYPMDADEMCTFIVVDFDNEDRSKKNKKAKSSKTKSDDAEKLQNPSDSMCFIDSFETLKREASAFMKTCVANHVSAYLEISRSGNGFHVWIFFSERISAKKARQLCDVVYTAAMNEYADLSFGSYDRYIPSQDNLPRDNGLGNLIALPLQGSAGKRGYSLFIDEDFKHYSDQWEFLSTIKKMHPLEVEQILDNLSQSDNLGELMTNAEEDGIDSAHEKERPWDNKKPDVNLKATDFDGEVEVISANMIYIEKSKLSVRAINKLVRLGAYKNPEFYKAQAMRKRTDNKPRIVSTVVEDSGYICIPRGALNGIKELFENAGVQYYVTDKTTEGRVLDVSFIGELKEDQKPAVDALLSHEIGVFSAAGGFGKTVIGTYLIAKRAVNTLVLVHSEEVYEQWKGSLQKHLEINDSPTVRLTPKGREKVIGVIGEYSGKKKHLSGLVDVAMTQSLSRDVDEKLFIKDYGMVIIDECHRIPAVTFETVLKQVSAKYVYGLTATPYRDDGHHAILFLRCGPIRYKVDDIEQAQKRPFNHFVIPRFTDLLPTSVHETDNTQQLITEVGADMTRNELIVNDILASVKSGRNPIVLSERIEHVATLARLLAGKCDKVIMLTGSMKPEEKRTADRILSEVKDGDEYVIVATGKYAGEGFDFPRLDTLFLVLPISFKGKINQYTGRLHRLYEGKKDVIVYDYVDINNPVLERMYYKRVSGYKSVGYKTAVSPVITSKFNDVTNIIFAYEDYFETFFNDVMSATSEIVLSCPYLTGSGVASIMKTLSVKIIENNIVTIITRPTNEHAEDRQSSIKNCVQRLVDAGAKVVECSGLHQRFAVIDRSISWYGSVNFLGFSRKDDNVMRLVDSDIAVAILKQHHGHKAFSQRDEQISLFAMY